MEFVAPWTSSALPQPYIMGGGLSRGGELGGGGAIKCRSGLWDRNAQLPPPKSKEGKAQWVSQVKPVSLVARRLHNSSEGFSSHSLVRCFFFPYSFLVSKRRAVCALLFFAPGRNSHRIPRNKRHLCSATVFLNLFLIPEPAGGERKKIFPLSKLFFSVFISPSSLLSLSALRSMAPMKRGRAINPGGEEGRNESLFGP